MGHTRGAHIRLTTHGSLPTAVQIGTRIQSLDEGYNYGQMKLILEVSEGHREVESQGPGGRISGSGRSILGGHYSTLFLNVSVIRVHLLQNI